MNNSNRNIKYNFTQAIKRNNNKLSELMPPYKNSKVNPKNINFIKSKIINKSSANASKKKESLILSTPIIYRSILNDIQGSNSKRGLIKSNISEYKPFFSEREKFDILYNKNNNSSKKINGGQNYNFFSNINKKLKEDKNNNGNTITIKNKNKFPYQYSFNNTNKKCNTSNISNKIINSNFGQRLKTKHKTDLIIDDSLEEIRHPNKYNLKIN